MASDRMASDGSQTQQINIEVQDDHLRLISQQAGKEASTLRAESAKRFYTKNFYTKKWDGEVEFNKDEHGVVTMLNFNYTNETATE